jgi:hypothetical protein
MNRGLKLIMSITSHRVVRPRPFVAEIQIKFQGSACGKITHINNKIVRNSQPERRTARSMNDSTHAMCKGFNPKQWSCWVPTNSANVTITSPTRGLIVKLRRQLCDVIRMSTARVFLLF